MPCQGSDDSSDDDDDEPRSSKDKGSGKKEKPKVRCRGRGRVGQYSVARTATQEHPGMHSETVHPNMLVRRVTADGVSIRVAKAFKSQ